MKKLLITGASGFLGQYLCSEAIANFELKTVSRNDITNSVDLANEVELKHFLQNLKVDAIIHLAANGDINYCENNYDETYALNVRATEILAQFAQTKNLPFVFTSTDQVFDGTKGNYSEEDLPNPLNNYGKQKLLAEELVIKNKGIVCRMPLMLGEKGGYQKSLTENLTANKTQILFIDEWRSVLNAEFAALGLIKALNWPSGIYHLGGPKRMNRYELGLEIAKNIKNVDLNLIQKGKQTDVIFLAKRPADVSLNSEKALSLGFEN